jgi:hypothetical protein
MYKRLSRLYHGVLNHMRTLEWLAEHGMRRANTSVLPLMDPMEPRLMLSASPTGQWLFDEGSGTTAYDSAPVNPPDNGVEHNTTYIAGKTGDALSFNGSNSYVTVASSSNLSPASAMTLSC